MQDTDKDPATETENQIVGKLARVLYSGQSEGAFDKADWEARRTDFRKQARKMLRAMEKQGLKVDLAG